MEGSGRNIRGCVEDGLDNDEFSDEPTSETYQRGRSRYQGGWFRGNDGVVDGARPSYDGVGRWLLRPW